LIFHCDVSFAGGKKSGKFASLKNSSKFAPEKRPFAPKGNNRLPSHFQLRASFREGIQQDLNIIQYSINQIN